MITLSTPIFTMILFGIGVTCGLIGLAIARYLSTSDIRFRTQELIRYDKQVRAKHQKDKEEKEKELAEREKQLEIEYLDKSERLRKVHSSLEDTDLCVVKYSVNLNGQPFNLCDLWEISEDRRKAAGLKRDLATQIKLEDALPNCTVIRAVHYSEYQAKQLEDALEPAPKPVDPVIVDRRLAPLAVAAA